MSDFISVKHLAFYKRNVPVETIIITCRRCDHPTRLVEVDSSDSGIVRNERGDYRCRRCDCLGWIEVTNYPDAPSDSDSESNSDSDDE